LPVERDPVCARAIQVQDHFHVAASHFLFQHPAQLHLQRVGVGRQAEVKIQKTMIHGFQRQGKRQLGIDLPFDLRESGHGAKCHKFPGFKVSEFQRFKVNNPTVEMRR
jgi:hypothetical protein